MPTYLCVYIRRSAGFAGQSTGFSVCGAICRSSACRGLWGGVAFGLGACPKVRKGLESFQITMLQGFPEFSGCRSLLCLPFFLVGARIAGSCRARRATFFSCRGNGFFLSGQRFCFLCRGVAPVVSWRRERGWVRDVGRCRSTTRGTKNIWDSRPMFRLDVDLK